MTERHKNSFEAHITLAGAQTPGLLILVDHARSDLPPGYGSLGLAKPALARHIAYDIGIEAVARGLHERLNVPVVMAGFSRLLIDPNRGEDDPTLIMQLSDGAIVPGNEKLSDDERARRLNDFYLPYHQAVSHQIDQFLSARITPILLSLHSFTPSWRGRERPFHVGVLWDQDDRFSRPLIDALHSDGDLIVGDNQPYTGRLRGDCMYRHGTLRGLPHALLEIRQDLIREKEGQAAYAKRLALILNRLLADDDLIGPCRSVKNFGSATDC